jgi:hypothetical protein
VSSSINSRNKKVRKDSKSGIQGVRYHTKRKSWLVDWTDLNKKRKYKYFSTRKHGENAKKMAIEYRKKIENELYQRIN